MLVQLNRSFARRLSFYLLLFTALVFVGTFVVVHNFATRSVERTARQNAQNKLEITNLSIDAVLSRVEMVPDNLRRMILDVPADSLYGITRDVVENNPDIYGCAIAFEPGYFPEKGHYFSPYSYREGGNVYSKQLGNKDYDYFTWDWYATPKQLDHSYWSEPYYDEGGGQMLMCTYSAPIYDSKGRFVGIFTSDISLTWLTDMIEKVNLYQSGYSFMIGRDGHYIVHRNTKRIMRETIFDAGREMKDSTIVEIGRNMIQGKTGEAIVANDGVPSWIFYGPVSRNGWSIGIVCPNKEVYAALSRLNMVMLIIGLVGLGLLFLFTFNIIRRLTTPLRSFAESAHRIAKGEFDTSLPEIRSRDEMRELHDSFLYMKDELVNYIANLQATSSAKEKIESELRIAREIQMGMIPKIFPPFPDRREMDLYALLNPAKEVGGDLYDFFMEGDILYFTVGDVSGKGIPASLLMAVTRSLFRSIAPTAASPAAVASALNAVISENNDSNMFVTLFIGELNIVTRRMRYCNAGHNPPIIIAPEQDVQLFQVEANLPVGIIPGFEFKMQETTLEAGTNLLIYTDGVTEAENSQQELFGEERLLNTVRANRDMLPRGLITAVTDELALHVAGTPPSDDVTVLSLLLNPPAETITLSNRVDQLGLLYDFVESIGEKRKLPPGLVMKLQLALEELASNIILYAYPDSPEANFDIEVEGNADNLRISIIDSGIPFNPLEREIPNIALPALERPVGGLGIFLVRKIMDDIHYERRQGRNVLTMKKSIS